MPLNPLSAHLGYWLRLVSNHVSHAFAAGLAVHDVTVPEWVLLRTLHDAGPSAPSELAASLGMTRGAITKLVDHLVAEGRVVRAADPRDGRAQLVSLTDAGRALLPTLVAIADANDAAYFGVLSPERRQAVEDALRLVATAHQLTTPPIS